MKIWKLTLWKVSGVNDTLGHTFLKSLAAKDLWEREPLRFISRKPNFVHATNNLDVLILVLRISFSTRLRLAHTAYFNWSFQTSHRTLLASLSSNILFGDNKRGRGSSSLNSWFFVHLGRSGLREEDDTVFGYTSRIVLKNVANKLLHGGFIISFMKFIIILILILTDLSASNDIISIIIIIITILFSRIHWGNKLKFSSFSNSLLDLFTSYHLLWYRQILDLSSWSDTAGTSKYLPLGGACRLTSYLNHHFFKSLRWYQQLKPYL